MRIFITGCNGQVGTELMRQAAANQTETSQIAAIGLDLPDLDITNLTETEEIIESADVDLVINAAAYTAVDKAESEQQQAFAVNRDGPVNLATICQRLDIPLFHISTDYVFDGNKVSAYLENDPISPLNVYGNSKAQGEQAIRACLEQHLILRTSWVYSAHGNNFVKTVLRLCREKGGAGIVDDQYGCPTSAADIATTLLQLAMQMAEVEEPRWGTYHYCGAGKASWYEFARAIVSGAIVSGTIVANADTAGDYSDCQIKAITTADYPTPAIRPKNTVLDCSRIEQELAISPRPWQDSLKEVLAEITATDPVG